ncbi:hypothetical protein [Methylobacterium sp. CM6257]
MYLLLASGLRLLLTLRRHGLSGSTPRKGVLSLLRHERGARVDGRPRCRDSFRGWPA